VRVSVESACAVTLHLQVLSLGTAHTTEKQVHGTNDISSVRKENTDLGMQFQYIFARAFRVGPDVGVFY
jgi:hypothetical protein